MLVAVDEAASNETLAVRLRAICAALPEVTERLSHGAPTWFVRGKTTFATLWTHGHHQDDFPHLVCAAPPGVQAELVEAEPDRFFRPPYVGGRGWIGLRLDVGLDWDEVAEICAEAYRVVAPKRLVQQLDADQAAAGQEGPENGSSTARISSP
jgi:hypothetical protein